MRRLLIICGFFAFACASPSSAPAADTLVGSWQKDDTSLPPITLTVSREGSDLRARLRLSGTESNGVIVRDGTHIIITLEGSRGILTGELLSASDLELSLPAAGSSYKLHKQ